MSNIRIGIGYDVHRLVAGRPCIIGGVVFDHDRGLLGHSDADVLLHAIADALLGALNLGDIGRLFPDSDQRFKGADSKVLLKTCFEKIKEKGYKIGNLDTVIICEKPKIGPRRDEMSRLIAGILETTQETISIKATTEERMGFTGREEGIGAWACVLVEKL